MQIVGYVSEFLLLDFSRQRKAASPQRFDTVASSAPQILELTSPRRVACTKAVSLYWTPFYYIYIYIYIYI